MRASSIPDWIDRAVDGAAPFRLGRELTLIHGRVEMFIPVGGGHVRQAVLRFPKSAFPKRPTTLATVYGESTPGNPFSIYNVTWVIGHGNWHFCKLSAQARNPDESVIHCDYAMLASSEPAV